MTQTSQEALVRGEITFQEYAALRVAEANVAQQAASPPGGSRYGGLLLLGVIGAGVYGFVRWRRGRA